MAGVGYSWLGSCGLNSNLCKDLDLGSQVIVKTRFIFFFANTLFSGRGDNGKLLVDRQHLV